MLSDWLISYNGGPGGPGATQPFVLSGVSPIQGAASLAVNYGPNALQADVMGCMKKTGAGVNTGLIRTLVRHDYSSPTVDDIHLVSLSQALDITGFTGFPACYWTSIRVGGGTYSNMALSRNNIGGGQNLGVATAAFPFGQMLSGNIYAIGLQWQHDPMTDAMFITLLSSPGTVTGAYDYSTMVVIGSYLDATPSRITSGVTAGLGYTYVSNVGQNLQVRFDVTDICI